MDSAYRSALTVLNDKNDYLSWGLTVKITFRFLTTEAREDIKRSNKDNNIFNIFDKNRLVQIHTR